MEHTILHQAGFTVTMDSKGQLTLKEAGKLPTLDDIARQRARDAYFVDKVADMWEDFLQTDPYGDKS